MTVSPTFQVTGVGEFAALLAQLPDRTKRELRPRMLHAGGIVGRRAQANASWSTRIPGAISVKPLTQQNAVGAVVTVSAAKAPHARAYEGINGNPTFRHPVYGNRSVWVTEDTRPFLAPAGDATEGEARQLVQDALRAALP